MLLKDIEESILVKKSIIFHEKKIKRLVKIISNKLSFGGKILLCGNGGSAADAQHIAAEFLVRLRHNIDRKALPAISLATDTSTITACSNDYNFNKIYSRTFEALANKNDILIAISTSGNSKNIIEVLKVAKKRKIFSVAFLGNNGGVAKRYCDIDLIINSKKTSRIQEAHIFLGHHIAEQIENFLILKKYL